MSTELDQLRTAVNAARYRGLNSKGEMADHYRHPFDYEQLEAIAEAARAVILAEEAALAASIQQKPEVAQSSADTTTPA